MAFLNSVFANILALPTAVTPSVTAPGSMWHLLILNVFSFVVDYGWRIVVFTLLLKLVLSPLDFYQRYKMNKNQRITERLKPTMEKLQKQYAGDKQAFSQKQMELNRKEGYSYFSSCLPMILTMVIFITLWLSMQTIAQYMTFREYTTMYDEYRYVRCQIYDPEAEHPELDDTQKATMTEVSREIGQDVIYTMYYRGLDDGYIKTLTDNPKYKDYIPKDFTLLPEGVSSFDKVQSDFLWIKNIWAPDVPWGDKAILDWSAFSTGVNKYKNAETSGVQTEEHAKAFNEPMYNEVMGKLLSDTETSRTNGYLILPILVVLLSLAQQFISMAQSKRAGQTNANGGVATSMKVMMVIMPIMMAVFAIQYASIFALYMVTNYAVSLVLNLAFTGIIKLIEKHKSTRDYGIATGRRGTVGTGDSAIIHYVKGANPRAGERVVEPAADTTTIGGGKSKKQKSTPASVRGSRPDPNELMGMDMSRKKKK